MSKETIKSTSLVSLNLISYFSLVKKNTSNNYMVCNGVYYFCLKKISKRNQPRWWMNACNDIKRTNKIAMEEIKEIHIFEKLIEFYNYDHLSERDQYEISLMKKNIQKAVYKYVTQQWETWAANRILEGSQGLEEPTWNARNITEEVVKQYTNDILPEKVMRYYEAYIYNCSAYRNSWIWGRYEFGGLKSDKYYVIM